MTVARKVARKKKDFKNLPTGKPHISFSEMSDWIDCSWRHMLKQILKIDLSTFGVALDYGTGMHASCEDYLQTRKMDKTIAIKFITEKFEEQQAAGGFYEYVRFDPDDEAAFKKILKAKFSPKGKGAKAALQELFEKYDNDPEEKANIVYEHYLNDYLSSANGALDDVSKFMDETFPNWEFVDAEHELYEEIENHPDHAFKGFIDGIIKCDGKRGKKVYWLIDWKTCGWGWTREQKTDKKKQKQLILYKNYWSKKLGVNPSDIRCGFALLKRVAKPGTYCELIPVSVGNVSTQRSLEVIDDMFASMNRKMYVKNKTNCYWCDYKGTKHCKNSKLAGM